MTLYFGLLANPWYAASPVIPAPTACAKGLVPGAVDIVMDEALVGEPWNMSETNPALWYGS